MESVGERLKKIRLEKGLSLEDVQRKTKVHLNILKAIEEDNIVNLSPIYVKGFLKIYCNFLGADPRDYISDYRETQKVVNISALKQEQDKAASRLKNTSALFSLQSLRQKARPILAAGLAVIFIIVLFNIGKAIAVKKKSWVARAKVTTAMRAKQIKKETVKTQEKTPEAKTESTVLRLGIRARENCWIQIKSDGHAVFQGLLRKGRSESWQAKEKIELAVGNAGVVDLEVNGKLISNLGRRGQQLKNILITKEGLSVGR